SSPSSARSPSSSPGRPPASAAASGEPAPKKSKETLTGLTPLGSFMWRRTRVFGSGRKIAAGAKPKRVRPPYGGLMGGLGLRRSRVQVLAVVLAAGGAVPWSTPYVLLALVPLYGLAYRRLRDGLLGSGAIVVAQVASMDQWVEPISAAVLCGGVVAAA